MHYRARVRSRLLLARHNLANNWNIVINLINLAVYFGTCPLFAFRAQNDVQHEASRQRDRDSALPQESEAIRDNKQLYTIFHFVKLHLIAVDVN